MNTARMLLALALVCSIGCGTRYPKVQTIYLESRPAGATYKLALHTPSGVEKVIAIGQTPAVVEVNRDRLKVAEDSQAIFIFDLDGFESQSHSFPVVGGDNMEVFGDVMSWGGTIGVQRSVEKTSWSSWTIGHPDGGSLSSLKPVLVPRTGAAP